MILAYCLLIVIWLIFLYDDIEIYHLEWSLVYRKYVGVVTGRLFLNEFVNYNSMERILERYERYSYSEKQLLANDHESTVRMPFWLSLLVSKPKISSPWIWHPLQFASFPYRRIGNWRTRITFLGFFSFNKYFIWCHTFIYIREAGLWNMRSSRLGWRFYKEITGTKHPYIFNCFLINKDPAVILY